MKSPNNDDGNELNEWDRMWAKPFHRPELVWGETKKAPAEAEAPLQCSNRIRTG
jgi:hypothetical protein